MFGLGDWMLGRYRERLLAGMAPSWASVGQLNRRVLAFGGWSGGLPAARPRSAWPRTGTRSGSARWL